MVTEILALLNDGLSPILIMLALLVGYFFNDLNKKISKVDQIDSLIFQIKNLVEKLDGLIETQKVNKMDTDTQIEKLIKRDEETVDAMYKISTRLLIVETKIDSQD